jgi:hypothetical protein
MTTFYCLRFETPQPGGPGPRIYISQEQGGPVIPPGTGLAFVASYYSQDNGGGILTRLHTGFPWAGLGSSLYSPGADPTENTVPNSYIVFIAVI